MLNSATKNSKKGTSFSVGTSAQLRLMALPYGIKKLAKKQRISQHT
jgi:hypothetical protein